MMRKITTVVRYPMLRVLTLITVFLCCFDFAHANVVVSVPVSGGQGNNEVVVGESKEAYFIATDGDAPPNQQECQRYAKQWAWSVANAEKSTDSGRSWVRIMSFTSYTLTAKGRGDTALLNASFSSAGWYRLTVKADLTFGSDCGDGSGSGNVKVIFKEGSGVVKAA